MSDGFLTRWSRRKRQAAQGVDAPDQQSAEATRVIAEDFAAPASRPASEPVQADERQSAPPRIDPASLPPIETIGPGTDIRQFLAKGVPTELRDAALRRAWISDPAIRDFVGLAENAYDFNVPGGAPGFAPLEAGEEIARMVAQIISPRADVLVKPVESGLPAGGGDSAKLQQQQSDPALRPNISQSKIENAGGETSRQAEGENPVPQDARDSEPSEGVADDHSDNASTHRPVRTHGRALPQ